MKSSASAPSSLPSAKPAQKSTLFDDDEDDLFAPTKESRYLQTFSSSMQNISTHCRMTLILVYCNKVKLLQRSLTGFLKYPLVLPLFIVRQSRRGLLSCSKMRVMMMKIKVPSLASNMLLTQTQQPQRK